MTLITVPPAQGAACIMLNQSRLSADPQTLLDYGVWWNSYRASQPNKGEHNFSSEWMISQFGVGGSQQYLVWGIHANCSGVY